MRSTSPKTCCTTTGARPADGSSSSSSLGSDISARPIAHICCSPPDMRAGELAAALAQPREQLVDEGEASRNFAPRRTDEAAHPQIVLDRHAREQAAVLRHMRDAELDDAVRRRGARGRCLPS